VVLGPLGSPIAADDAALATEGSSDEDDDNFDTMTKRTNQFKATFLFIIIYSNFKTCTAYKFENKKWKVQRSISLQLLQYILFYEL